MRAKTIPNMILISLTGMFIIGTSFATPQVQNHEKHHIVAQADQKNVGGSMGGEMMNNNMTGSMDMNYMMNMNQQCQTMHTDSKMCDEEIMKKCTTSLEKEKCTTMMSQMKNQQSMENHEH